MTDMEWDYFSTQWHAYFGLLPDNSLRKKIPDKGWYRFYQKACHTNPALENALWLKLQSYVPELTDLHKKAILTWLYHVPPLGGLLFTHFRKIFSVQNHTIAIRGKWRKMATKLWLDAGCSWKNIIHYRYDLLLFDCITSALTLQYNASVLKRALRTTAPNMTEEEWLHSTESATIHFDGGFVAHKAHGVAAVVATNQFRARFIHTEHFHHHIKLPFLNHPYLTSAAVEAVACFRACELASKMNVPSIIYGDCSSVIEGFKRESKLYNLPWHRTQKHILKQLTWVPRKYNVDADFWAK